MSKRTGGAVAVFRPIVCSLLVPLCVLASPLAAIAQEKIRLGLLPFSESLGAVIAERQGFFKAEGLDVEVTKFESGALAVPVLQSGRIDIAFSNTVSTLQAMEQGLDAILPAWRGGAQFASRHDDGPHRAQRRGK